MGYYITLSDGTRVPAEGGGFLERLETITADKTLTVADSGKTFLVATDELTITLPSTIKGLEYTFINSGADGNNIITVSPAAADTFEGSFSYGGGRVVMSGTDNKDLVNTKASSKKGDSLSIRGDGAVGWYIEECTGVWLEESQVAGDILKNPLVTELVTDDKTLDANDSGKVFFIATDAKTFTLPATAVGLEYTFVNTGSDGNNIITISPNAADGIFGTITLAGTVVQMAGTADTDIINTKASALKGDMVKLIGDGVDGWAIVSISGIWASE